MRCSKHLGIAIFSISFATCFFTTASPSYAAESKTPNKVMTCFKKENFCSKPLTVDGISPIMQKCLVTPMQEVLLDFMELCGIQRNEKEKTFERPEPAVNACKTLKLGNDHCCEFASGMIQAICDNTYKKLKDKEQAAQEKK